MDRGYVTWAKNTEFEGAGECLQHFIEYVRAHENPADWDRAYMEGMSEALFKKAKQDHAQENEGDRNQALTISSKAIQAAVLDHFGIELKTCKRDLATTHGLRKARGSGYRDAAAVNLGQRQIGSGRRLAITA